mmetsp:Transcript_25250/g.75010  ORF Transcript_25250/g.75010 Transcript_25250/m.75010 type:complete len:998 (+) Transcript_25250:65-3058(+)
MRWYTAGPTLPQPLYESLDNTAPPPPTACACAEIAPHARAARAPPPPCAPSQGPRLVIRSHSKDELSEAQTIMNRQPPSQAGSRAVPLVQAARVEADPVWLGDVCAGRLERVGEQLRHLHVGDERHAKVDGEPADGVVGQDVLRELVGEHEHQLDVAALDVVVDAGLDAVLRVVEHRHRHALLLEVGGRLLGREERVAELLQLAHRRHRLGEEPLLHRDEDVLLGQLHARREHRLEEGVVPVRPEAGDLARRGHLDAERRVGALEALEGEHRHLDADIVVGRLGRALVDRRANHRLGGGLDEVDAHHLGREGARARGAQVALDHLDLAVLCDELHVEGAGDLERRGELVRDLLNLGHVGRVEGLRRQHQRRVARVHARVLDVLRHGVQQHLAVARHRVHVDLAPVLDELGDDDGVLLGDLRRLRQEAGELALRVGDVHRRAREDVRRPDEARVADARAKRERVLLRGEQLPLWLVDADAVAERGELVPVLGRVDHRRRRAGDVDAGRAHLERERVWDLAADRDDGGLAALLLVHVEHALERELLEVEAVALVEVGRDRLGVVVDHHGLLAELAQRADGRDGAPVELDRRADPVHARADHHRPLVLEVEVVLVAVVRHVQVVCGGRELGGHGVDLLDEGGHAHRLAQRADLELGRAGELRHLRVREARLFGLQHRAGGQRLWRVLGEDLAHVVDPLELPQEPGVDGGERLDPVHRVAALHRLGDRVDARVGRHLQRAVELLLALGHKLVVRLVAGDGGVRHAQRLLERLLPRAADGHHLADRLHRRADLARDAVELGEVPARHLGDDVVEGGLEAGGGRERDRVGQVGEEVAERQLGRHRGERVARRLGGERGRARQARVHLDDAVVVRVRVERVLDVALADDAEVAHDLDRRRAEHVVLVVGERLRGRYHDRLARVHAERVEVLHVADGDAVVRHVAHHLVLDLLPPLERLLDEDLRRRRECLAAVRLELLLGVDERRAEPAERKRAAHHAGEADRL